MDGLGIFANMNDEVPYQYKRPPTLHICSESDVEILIEYLVSKGKWLTRKEFAYVRRTIRFRWLLRYFVRRCMCCGIELPERKRGNGRSNSDKAQSNNRPERIDDMRDEVQRKITRRWLNAYERNVNKKPLSRGKRRKSDEFVKIIYVPMGGQGRKY